MPCHCGLGESTETCCGPIIEGKKNAPTAEALMRARFTAYAIGAIEYLEESIHPAHRDGVDRASTKAWSDNAEWHGLDVIATEAEGRGRARGVSFRTRSLRPRPGLALSSNSRQAPYYWSSLADDQDPR